MARDLSTVLWGKWIQGLCAGSGGQGLDPTKVMATGGLTVADWEVMDLTGLPSNSANPPSPGATIVPNLEQWADAMPGWSNVYVPSSDSFYNNYCAFLNAIQLRGGNAAAQQIADGYAINQATARKKLQADANQSNSEWATFNTGQGSLPPSAQKSYQQWYQENWASTILADQNQVAAQTQKLNQALATVGGPDYQTISQAQSKAAMYKLTGPDGNPYPGYAATPGLNASYVQWLQTVTDDGSPMIDITITLADDDSAKDYKNDYFAVSASVSVFCFGGSASYSQASGSQKYDSLVQGLTMHYTAQAAQIFNFRPGLWFDSSIVRDFYDQISPTSALANKPLFGKTGVLNLRTNRALVVYKPKVVLTGTKTQINSLATQFSQQSSASISVGGFCWSASASMSQGQGRYTQDVKISSDGTSMTMADNTNAPKVILIEPSKLNEEAKVVSVEAAA